MDDSAVDDPLRSVLGVIDLKAGKAVHAVRGNRDRYRPLRCTATDAGDAILLARMYLQSGVGGLYAADLDAITAAAPNTALLNRLAALGRRIWIDAGTAEIPFEQPDRVSRVVGTESIRSLADLQRLRECWSDRCAEIILSIDLAGGRVLGASVELSKLTAVEVAAEAIDRGFRSLIILDLTAVGSASGTVTNQICEQIAAEHPTVELASGGGIRSLRDVQLLKKAGCRRILVGTALHAGRKKFLFGGGTC